jgi:MFS family permease
MRFTQERRLFHIGFFFSFCIALAAYVNASYLKNYLSTESVGLVYSATALLTIFVLYFFEYIGGRFGVQKTLVASLILSGLSALFLSQQTHQIILVSVFILMQVGLVITKFSADILLETHKNAGEGEGSLRGAYLAITNFSWIVAAFVGGYIASINPQYIYGINSAVYITLAVVTLFTISQTKKDIFQGTSIFEKIRFTVSEINTKKVVISEFVLQTFYTIMVIFSPLYLREISGFNYTQIGLIFSIMLIPFALLQYPLGKIADRRYGEKEMMLVSYVILALSVFAFAIIEKHTFFSAALILFLSRIGACTLEVMNDTYFFTTTKDYKKTLPILKGMAPLSLLLFGIIGSTIATLFSYQTLFISLSIFIVLVSFINIYKLKDTR